MERNPVRDDQRRRLVWRCRRGMRELDMVFSAYLSQCYDSGEPEEQAAFERLIAAEDADVYSWLMGYTEPHDSTLQPIIEKMRKLLSNA